MTNAELIEQMQSGAEVAKRGIRQIISASAKIPGPEASKIEGYARVVLGEIVLIEADVEGAANAEPSE